MSSINHHIFHTGNKTGFLNYEYWDCHSKNSLTSKTKHLPNANIIVYQFNDKVKLFHKGATFNCCPEKIVVKSEIVANIINIYESEILGSQGGCKCFCGYNLRMTFKLEPDEYLINIYSYHKGKTNLIEQLNIEIQQTNVKDIQLKLLYQKNQPIQRKAKHYDWDKITPIEFLLSLKESPSNYIIFSNAHRPPSNWIKKENVSELIKLVESKEIASPVVSSFSSTTPRDSSTIGNEAMFLIEGYIQKRYPPDNHSKYTKKDANRYKKWWEKEKNI